MESDREGGRDERKERHQADSLSKGDGETGRVGTEGLERGTEQPQVYITNML